MYNNSVCTLRNKDISKNTCKHLNIIKEMKQLNTRIDLLTIDQGFFPKCKIGLHGWGEFNDLCISLYFH